MKTIDGASHNGRVAQLTIGLGAVVALHWSLKTLAPALSWLEEPSFAQSLAAAIGVIATYALVNLTRDIGSGRRDHERRTRRPSDRSGSTAAEAQP